MPFASFAKAKKREPKPQRVVQLVLVTRPPPTRLACV